jgi:hypothetical protein
MHYGPALACGSERQHRGKRQDHHLTVEVPAHGRSSFLRSFLLRDRWRMLVFRSGRESVHGVLSFYCNGCFFLGRIYLVPRFIHQKIQESGSTVHSMPPRHLQPTPAFLQSTCSILLSGIASQGRELSSADLAVAKPVWSEILRGAFGIPPCNFCASGCISVSLRRGRGDSGG